MHAQLRHIRAFLTLAEELHFGRSAERLHIAQPALSRTIRDLERSVGVKLLQRTTRHVELTEAGRAFLQECRLAEKHLDQAVTMARRVAKGMSGELRIAYMDFAISGRMPEFLRAFASRHPDIRMNLTYMPTTQQQVALLERKIDIGFMIGDFEHKLMENYSFDEDRYVAILPATHPLADRGALTLKEFNDQDFVLGNGDNWTVFRNRLFSLCRSQGFFPRIVQEASSSEGIFGLVAAGAGVSVYSSCVRNLQRRGIVVRPLDDVSATLPVTVVFERRNQSPALQTFWNFLQTVWGQ